MKILVNCMNTFWDTEEYVKGVVLKTIVSLGLQKTKIPNEDKSCIFLQKKSISAIWKKAVICLICVRNYLSMVQLKQHINNGKDAKIQVSRTNIE